MLCGLPYAVLMLEGVQHCHVPYMSTVRSLLLPAAEIPPYNHILNATSLLFAIWTSGTLRIAKIDQRNAVFTHTKESLFALQESVAFESLSVTHFYSCIEVNNILL
jgi:hypothetical protein